MPRELGVQPAQRRGPDARTRLSPLATRSLLSPGSASRPLVCVDRSHGPQSAHPRLSARVHRAPARGPARAARLAARARGEPDLPSRPSSRSRSSASRSSSRRAGRWCAQSTRASAPGSGQRRGAGSLAGQRGRDRLEVFVQRAPRPGSPGSFLRPAPPRRRPARTPSSQSAPVDGRCSRRGRLRTTGVDGADACPTHRTAATVDEPFALETLLGALWERLGAGRQESAQTPRSPSAAPQASGRRRRSASSRLAHGASSRWCSAADLLVISRSLGLDRIHALCAPPPAQARAAERISPHRPPDRRGAGEAGYRGRLLVLLSSRDPYLTLALAIAGVDYPLLLGMASGVLALSAVRRP